MSEEAKGIGRKWSELKRELGKKYGAGAVEKASKVESLEVKRIPTGIFAVDVVLGGGIPVGRATQVFGEPSSGKTTFCMKVVGQAQKTCRGCLEPLHGKKEGHEAVPMNCLWLDLESVFSKPWAERNGVNLEALDLAQPETAERAGNILSMFLQSEDGDLAVVDSIAHMTPGEELEQPAENAVVGVMARVMNRFFRNESALTNWRKKKGYGPTVMWVNQVRSKIGVMWGNPETRPGGMGQLFATSLEIRLSPGKPFFEGGESKNPGDGALPVFTEVNFEIKKSKVGVPHVKESFKLQLRDFDGRKAGTTNEEEQILAYAKRYRFIENPERGKWLCPLLGLQETTEEKLEDKIVESGRIGELRKALMERVLVP